MQSSSKAIIDATKKRAEKLLSKGKDVDFKERFGWSPTAAQRTFGT
jgi:hypothetical protein